MARSSTKFVCNSCGFESGKWYGKCPECNNWNTFEEVTIPDKKASGGISRKSLGVIPSPQKIYSIKSILEERITTGFEEFDRVLGGVENKGGIVPGSVILLSGDPGIGKSTILLQLALNLSSEILVKSRNENTSFDSKIKNQSQKTVLYITGEESEHQVRMRASRIITEKELEKSKLLILSSTNIDMAVEVMNTIMPGLVIIDSVQTLSTDQLPGFAGSVPQIRYVTSRLVTYAKQNSIPVFLVGHVTKDGLVAGPMVLSHMVDTVLYLEGEPLSGTRILRSFKNRFGDTSEVGIFVMEEKGLVEIKNAASFFMNNDATKKDGTVPGSCIAVVMEGSRPILVEIQALTVPTSLSFARRVSTGIPEKRLELLLAVIQKHAKLPIERTDVFLNVVGGLKITETAGDLAACLAIISSFKNRSLKIQAAIGEVGLLGELKIVTNLDKRIKEAKKFGFEKVASSKLYGSLSTAVAQLID